MTTTKGGVIHRFARLIVKRPTLMLVGSGLIFVVLGAVGVFGREEKPAFDQAQRGFEARATAGAGLVFAATRGTEIMQCNGELTAMPFGGERTYHRWASYQNPTFENTWCKDPNTNAIGSDRRRRSPDIITPNTD